METGEGSNKIEALIQSFLEITLATRDEAQSFLESKNWDLDSAVSTFLDNAAPAGAQPVVPPSPHSTSYSRPERLVLPRRSRSVSPLRRRSRRGVQKLQLGCYAKVVDKGEKPAEIKNVDALNPSGKDDSYEPQKDDNGGEKSGMPVQDSTRGQSSRAEVSPGQDVSILPSSSSRSFTATGTLLSGKTVAPAQGQQPEPLVFHTIYFWRNGFSVDDGPLRRMDDPQNAPFLESVRRSECPKELEPADPSIQVHVLFERRDENYTEPKKPKLAFQGGGSSSDVPVASTHPVKRPPAPLARMGIDRNAPRTTIQIRLADGTRIVSRFNYHQTVADIRAFINASRPGTSTTYQLQLMGFPPARLLDSSQTIAQAGLANSVIIQKF